MIKYKSTRGDSAERTAAQAVIQGLAEDRGLYVPDSHTGTAVPDFRNDGKTL